MRTRKVESIHKCRVTTNIFAPVTGEPVTNEHDGIRRETARSKVGGTTSSKRLTRDIVRKV
jgi:hypothetical protein